MKIIKRRLKLLKRSKKQDQMKENISIDQDQDHQIKRRSIMII